MPGPAAAQQPSTLTVRAGVLRLDSTTLAPISRFDLPPVDLGLAGARLADDDNNTTGRFLGHSYATTARAVPAAEGAAALDAMLAEGLRLFVILADAPDLVALADRAASQGALVLNAGSPADRLRGEDCRANLLHVAPSDAMMADAVGQFARWKQWSDWVLVVGSHPADQALAEDYRKAARKFGARIVEERVVADTGGARRTDTGHVLVQKQLPVFMQGLPEHDVVIAADASDRFAPYLPYHLWTPRPVLGSAGLRPVTFHPAHEAWGATQFHTRFEKGAGRLVHEEDYQVWLALRVIGEAATRTGKADPEAIRAYALGPQFELAAFKGTKVTFRDWDGQMRQPILLYDDRITVSVSPQDGFLHQVSPLDSLGIDRPETACTAFAAR